MRSTLFDQLENAGLLVDGKPNMPAIRRTKASRIIDLAQESGEITTAKQLRREGSIYAHTASLSLGGGAYPCRALECRLQRANKLAQFAAFYSDRVYIKNFLVELVEDVVRRVGE